MSLNIKELKIQFDKVLNSMTKKDITDWLESKEKQEKVLKHKSMKSCLYLWIDNDYLHLVDFNNINIFNIKITDSTTEDPPGISLEIQNSQLSIDFIHKVEEIKNKFYQFKIK